MIDQIDKADAKVRDLKLIDCFAKGTWLALCLALLCLFADAYVVIYMPLHRSAEEHSVYHPSTMFLVASRMIEVTLALVSFWLLHYAFSRPPRLPARL